MFRKVRFKLIQHLHIHGLSPRLLQIGSLPRVILEPARAPIGIGGPSIVSLLAQPASIRPDQAAETLRVPPSTPTCSRRSHLLFEAAGAFTFRMYML